MTDLGPVVRTPDGPAGPPVEGGPAEPAPQPPGGRRGIAWSEVALCLVLLGVGTVVLIETARLHVPAVANVVGPRYFPTLVGISLILAGVLLGREVLAGRRAEPEAGEDVDVRAPTDWRALGMLALALATHILFLKLVGYVLAVTVLFALAARGLGSTRFVRDLGIGTVLGLIVYLAFDYGLGITLPTGPLEGLL